MRWKLLSTTFACIAFLAGHGSCPAQGAADLPTPANEAAAGTRSPGKASAGQGFDGTAINPAMPIRVAIDHPRQDAVLQETSLEVRVRAENFLLREGGNRLQVVLDNRRSVLVYDTTAPVAFTNLAPGGHMLRVFAAAGDGRYAPGEEAFAAVTFYSLKQGVENIPEPGEPVLSVSSPRGTYEGEAGGLIVFDYRVHGVTLSPTGYRLRFFVDGRERITHEGGPILLPALGPGKHRLVAEIVDMDDVTVPGIYSKVGTTFDIKAPDTAGAPIAPLKPPP